VLTLKVVEKIVDKLLRIPGIAMIACMIRNRNMQ
jgi:hypothetical protein